MKLLYGMLAMVGLATIVAGFLGFSDAFQLHPELAAHSTGIYVISSMEAAGGGLVVLALCLLFLRRR